MRNLGYRVQSPGQSLSRSRDTRFLGAVLLLLAMSSQVLWATPPLRNAIVQLIRHNRLEEAERQLWGVLARQPDQGWALDLMAGIRVRQKRMPEAEALFRKAATLNPQDVEAWRGLGDVYTAIGNDAQALDSYSHVVVIAPAHVKANEALAILYQQRGQYNESVMAVERIPMSLRATRLLSVLAADYFVLNRSSEVPALIASLLRAKSDMAAVGDFVAVLLRNGYVDDAAHIMEIAAPQKPSAGYLHSLARVRAAQKRLPDAQNLLGQALKLEPKSFDLLFDSARLAAQQNQWNETVIFLRRADQVKRDQPEILQKLSLALLKRGNHTAAVAVARRLNSTQPDNPDNEYVLASALLEDGLPEEAEPIARKVAAARPQDANSVLLLAIAEFKKGDTAAAKQDLLRCLAIDPNSADAHYHSGLIAQREGDLKRAQAELQEAVRINPSRVSAQETLGLVDLQLGDLEGARVALEQAVKLAPGAPQTHYQLGLAYQRLGLQDRARVEMETYQKLRHSEDEAHKRRVSQDSTAAPPL
jgi:tetratricopeptide (TPR) repeat protein